MNITGSFERAGELALTIAGCVVSHEGALLDYNDAKVCGTGQTLFDRVKYIVDGENVHFDKK